MEITNHKSQGLRFQVSGFRFQCSGRMEVSVFRFQLFCFFSLTPDT